VKDSDKIIVLEEGKIKAYRHFSELEAQGIDLERVFFESEDKSKKCKEEMKLPLDNVEEELMTEADILSSKHSRQQKKHITILSEARKEREHSEKGNDIDIGKIFTEENADASKVNLKTYMTYFKSIFNICTFFLFVALLVGNELANIAYEMVIGFWAEDTINGKDAALIGGFLSFGVVIIYTLKSLYWNKVVLDSAQKIHNKMLEQIVRSPIVFFDSNPVGRILNRFSNDQGIIDRLLPQTMFNFIQGICYFLGLFITVWVINHYLLIPGAVAFFFYSRAVKYTAKSIRETRAQELLTRGPMYSHFSMTLAGLISVRSYKQTERFHEEFIKMVDNNAKAGCYYWYSVQVNNFLIDLISAGFVIVCISILIAMKSTGTDLNFLAMACMYLLSISELFSYILVEMVKSNVMMANAARAFEYLALNSEAPLVLPKDEVLKKDQWPQQGKIVFDNVSLKYREESEHIIKNLSLEIMPGEKIGCVGRTGAGKSSILQMLFRLVEVDTSTEALQNSSIKIDNIDTSDIGLHLLRRKISIIPQLPVVFSGTIRSNIDPFGDFSDQDIWNALKQVNLE